VVDRLPSIQPKDGKAENVVTRRSASAALTVVLATSALAACGGTSPSSPGGSSSSSGGGSSLKGQTITYWASNQGSSLEDDKKKLAPELAKFTEQTGVKVNLEVVGWPDLLNRILAATTSGKSPDALNIGNTWSASLQATGALLPWTDSAIQTVGGKDRFLAGSLAATGAPGKPPTALPIYSLAYALYYNKKQFAAAGISQPPTTWDELATDAKKLTGHGKWGLALEAGNPTENSHHAFAFAEQYGGTLFDSSGKAQFDQPGVVAGIKRYIDFMAVDKIVNPSNAESSGNQSITDFATGKAAMMLWQAAGAGIKSHGMSTSEYGVAPIPFQAPAPAGGKHVNSMVAGINLAVFENSKHKDAAMAFVKFMTSDQEQIALNKSYGSLPSVQSAYTDASFQTPEVKTLRKVLATSAAPLPAVPQESQFETLVGTAMKDLFAQAASGKPVTADDIKAKLTAANQQIKAGG